MCRHFITWMLTVAADRRHSSLVLHIRRQSGAMGKVLRTFGLGILSVVPALFVAALPEECAKLLVIRGYSARLPSFDEPMDGLVYGAAAAPGLAALENVLYVSRGSLGTAILRAVSAVTAHAVTGAMIGYAISSAMFVPRSHARTWKGLVAAIVCHGLYDLGLFAASFSEVTNATSGIVDIYLLMTIGVLIVEISWLRRTIRRLRRTQLLARAGGQSTQATFERSFVSRLTPQDDELPPEFRV